MTLTQAESILNPKTFSTAIDYFSGFAISEEKKAKALEEASKIGAAAIREQIEREKQPHTRKITMKIYIAGKITGAPDYKHKFSLARIKLARRRSHRTLPIRPPRRAVKRRIHAYLLCNDRQRRYRSVFAGLGRQPRRNAGKQLLPVHKQANNVSQSKGGYPMPKCSKCGKPITSTIVTCDGCRGWINVKDRLPEAREDVLVVAFWNEAWQTMIGWHGEVCEIWHIITMRGDESGINVTHWMPLPEPPKEEHQYGVD